MNKVKKIKVVCLNLWLGGILFDDILEFLKQENPDLVLLQEAFDGKDPSLRREYRSLSVLRENLDYEYFHFAPAFLENIGGGRKIEQGNAILSRLPIEEESIKFFDVPFGDRIDELAHYPFTPRNLQHVLVDLGDQKLHILNTQGIWGTHGDDTERRLKMGEFIVSEVKGKSPLVLAGDLNLNPDTKTVKKIEDVLESVFKEELKTSFNLSRKDLVKDPGYKTSAVDMMFVSKDIRIIEYKCPNVDVSDHLPLVAELEIV